MSKLGQIVDKHLKEIMMELETLEEHDIPLYAIKNRFNESLFAFEFEKILDALDLIGKIKRVGLDFVFSFDGDDWYVEDSTIKFYDEKGNESDLDFENPEWQAAYDSGSDFLDFLGDVFNFSAITHFEYLIDPSTIEIAGIKVGRD